jgi:hypothetical protein
LRHELTDSTEGAHLITCVTYVDENKIKENLLFCKEISQTSKVEELFNIIDSYMTTNRLDWSNCMGLCTDGARSMSGIHRGLQALIPQKSPYVVWTHCILHRQALLSKHISPESENVLAIVINVVNYIKTRPLKAKVLAGFM